jgi:hypothetical protein
MASKMSLSDKERLENINSALILFLKPHREYAVWENSLETVRQ